MSSADRTQSVVADTLLATVGRAGIVGAWEAGAFVVLLPDSGMATALQAIEAALDVLRNESVSFSAGLTDATGAESLWMAVAHAGRGLLEARAEGGGRIRVAADRRLRESGPRILMIEDDETTSALVRHRLERDGMEVEQHARGSDAMEILARDDAAGEYDLVLLDMKLPGADGFEILRELRGRAGWQDVPVVMLTGMGREDDIVRAFDFGASDYVLKPFSPAELLARVNRLLRTG